MQWCNRQPWNRGIDCWSSLEMGSRSTFRPVFPRKDKRFNKPYLQQNPGRTSWRREAWEIFEIQENLLDGADGCEEIYANISYLRHLCGNERYKLEVEQLPTGLCQDRLRKPFLRIYKARNGASEDSWGIQIEIAECKFNMNSANLWLAQRV